jgi:hypothetical protein
MSLKEKLKQAEGDDRPDPKLFDKFGIIDNPFPSASQTSNNPHRPLPLDAQIDARIV